jgi:hypothetical protein
MHQRSSTTTRKEGVRKNYTNLLYKRMVADTGYGKNT